MNLINILYSNEAILKNVQLMYVKNINFHAQKKVKALLN